LFDDSQPTVFAVIQIVDFSSVTTSTIYISKLSIFYEK